LVVIASILFVFPKEKNLVPPQKNSNSGGEFRDYICKEKFVTVSFFSNHVGHLHICMTDGQINKEGYTGHHMFGHIQDQIYEK
jgi:hypothetical protein